MLFGGVEQKSLLGIILGAVMLVAGVLVRVIVVDPAPTAMDVYRGNTTLEVTYKDGVPVDSVVVFKDK